jgi:predicted RNase H-like HicB family nuclease
MKFTVEYEQEEDGRWLAEVKELPGVLTYGKDPDDAMAHAQALALRVLADHLENGEVIE